MLINDTENQLVDKVEALKNSVTALEVEQRRLTRLIYEKERELDSLSFREHALTDSVNALTDKQTILKGECLQLETQRNESIHKSNAAISAMKEAMLKKNEIEKCAALISDEMNKLQSETKQSFEVIKKREDSLVSAEILLEQRKKKLTDAINLI